ncbi:Acyl transferase acyl hydrolase lysophospholipase [Fusarium albosuccineum]|uniref:Acyl transferase acyl hydrolase lysophospholipase n=1 Tax=Fusarium albosuccineum TaxID=1237068 RepID=A0A8H4LLW4_9HYPO|nr:Acyl transferase acyl hydrolase lysophospholipase [Fusarium albosuccineum]
MASPSSFDQLDHSKLFKAPVSNKEESMMQEELTLLCMLDHHERIKHLPPQSWYWVKHRDWIAKQIESARKGNYDIARNVPRLLCLTQKERQTEIMRLRAELVKLPKGPMATGVARVRDNCEALFTGKADALSLLLRGNTLTRIYDVGSFDHSDFMQAFSQAKPNLKVLEIVRKIYTFSDLSAGFFPLDFFVCLGSCTGTIGNRGQSAYAAANVFLDHFAQWRNSQGLPGTCIDLSAVQGVRYLAREKERQEEVFRTIGGKPITENEVLALLAAAITGQASSSCDSVYLTGLQANATSRDMFWAQDARFQRLFDAFIKDDGGVAASAESRLSVSQTLRTAESTEDALEAVYEALINKIASVLMLTPEEVRRAHSVLSAGLDSLVAIEVRNWITREAGASVQILEIQNSPSLKSLAKTILGRSSFANEN